MRKAIAFGWTLGLALVCASSLSAQSNPSQATPTDSFTVPAGKRVVLELQDYLHTRHNEKGDVAHFLTVREVLSGYQVVVPQGSTVRATLTKVKRPGRLKGRAEIRLRFEEIELPDGTVLPFSAEILRAGFRDVDNDDQDAGFKGEGNKSRDAIQVGMAGAQGALLGAAVGGKKGAAYGGAIGAGIGLLGLLLERGPELSLPRGMLFEVQLQEDLAVPGASVTHFAQRRSSQPPPSPSGSIGGFQFPGETTPPPTDEPEIPDFEDPSGAESQTGEDTTEVAVNRPPSLPPGPPPPPYDPSLGDPDDYTLRVDVQLVMVEAFVRDDHGRPLDDLKKEDFRLYEDRVEQKIRHFSRDELPLAVALVVDRSGSVASYMPELRRAAYQTLTRLKPGDQVALFAFASGVQRLEDLTTDRRRIAERISRIRAGGGTNIVDALFEATYYLQVAAPDRRRAIILISDNHGTERGSVDDDDLVRMALEGGVVIYSIKTPGENPGGRVFGIPMPSITLGTGSVEKMTEQTGGEIIDVRRTGSLTAALDTVISRLKTRYTLGYHSTHKAHDGAFRKIDVRLDDRFGRFDRDYTVHARKGYYAPTDTSTVASE